jgi:hypothetical protein
VLYVALRQPQPHQPHQPHGVKEFQAKLFFLVKVRSMGLMGCDGVEGGFAVAAFSLLALLFQARFATDCSSPSDTLGGSMLVAP